MNINPCPMCGSPAKLDSTGAIECYGHAWQTVSIECTDVMGKHCDMDLSLSADFFYTKVNIDKLLVETWNKL